MQWADGSREKFSHDKSYVAERERKRGEETENQQDKTVNKWTRHETRQRDTTRAGLANAAIDS